MINKKVISFLIGWCGHLLRSNKCAVKSRPGFLYSLLVQKKASRIIFMNFALALFANVRARIYARVRDMKTNENKKFAGLPWNVCALVALGHAISCL